MYPSLLKLKAETYELFTYAKNTVILPKNVAIESLTNIQVNKVLIGSGCQLMNENGSISLLNYIILGDNVKLKPCAVKKGTEYVVDMQVKGPVMIGNNSFIRARKIGQNVIIGDNCKIGEGCILNTNCLLQDNSVMAPNTIVPSNCIFGGNPAVFVATLSEQAQSQMGMEIEMRFFEIEQDLAAYTAKKIKEREQGGGSMQSSSRAGVTPSASQRDGEQTKSK